MTAQKGNYRKWKVLSSNKPKNVEEIIDTLSKNRNLVSAKEKREFFNPTHPDKLDLRTLGISEGSVKRAISRIKKAVKDKERIIVYGDYDADGICATAILWETLYALDKKTLPYIPERFSEGYGLNAKSIQKLKTQNPKLKLIISVDNGIVAHSAVMAASKLGIDVIVTDHHQKGKVIPKARSIIHTDKISGSAISWIFSRELRKKLPIGTLNLMGDGLELAAMGTIADQLPLIGANRSFALFGLEKLRETKRPGLLELFIEAGIDKDSISSYTVGFMIAPRINAMGRIKHAIESLRLLCIKDKTKAKELALYLGKTNNERQKIVNEVVLHAREQALSKSWSGAIVVSHESYHEGVIGLAAAKLVEEFWRPSIVLSKGKDISKASARSIPGFNIIELIRKFDDLLDDGGGHPMAAGFSIKTERLEVFTKRFEEESTLLLDDEILMPQTKVDLEIEFGKISWKLVEFLKRFEPTGLGNPTPVFVTYGVKVVEAKTVGSDGKHLKLKLEKNKNYFDAIGFGLGNFPIKSADTQKVDIVYSVEENIWNGNKSIQLKVKDLRKNNINLTSL